MKNNFPTDADDDEPEIIRKLDELHAHQRKLLAASIRRTKFYLALLVTVSVSLGWILRAIFFA